MHDNVTLPWALFSIHCLPLSRCQLVNAAFGRLLLFFQRANQKVISVSISWTHVSDQWLEVIAADLNEAQLLFFLFQGLVTKMIINPCKLNVGLFSICNCFHEGRKYLIPIKEAKIRYDSRKLKMKKLINSFMSFLKESRPLSCCCSPKASTVAETLDELDIWRSGSANKNLLSVLCVVKVGLGCFFFSHNICIVWNALYILNDDVTQNHTYSSVC